MATRKQANATKPAAEEAPKAVVSTQGNISVAEKKDPVVTKTDNGTIIRSF